MIYLKFFHVLFYRNPHLIIPSFLSSALLAFRVLNWSDFILSMSLRETFERFWFNLAILSNFSYSVTMSIFVLSLTVSLCLYLIQNKPQKGEANTYIYPLSQIVEGSFSLSRKFLYRCVWISLLCGIPSRGL